MARPASSSSVCPTWRPRFDASMSHAQKVEEKKLKADQEALEAEAAEAEKS